MDHLALVVAEESLNLDLSSLLNAVLDTVRAVIKINDFARNFDLLAITDMNFKSVTARLAVFTVVITGLDNKLDWFVDSSFISHAGTVAE